MAFLMLVIVMLVLAQSLAHSHALHTRTLPHAFVGEFSEAAATAAMMLMGSRLAGRFRVSLSLLNKSDIFIPVEKKRRLAYAFKTSQMFLSGLRSTLADAC